MSRRPTPAPLGGRGLRRAAAPRRGQVLLVAVFVLFGVAVLAALFIGILGAHIMQVARYTDVGALRAAAEGGLRLANDRLLYSAPGADWRPGTQAIPVGDGQVRLKVSYGPTPDDLQSRYLLVSATATLPNDPFASYTVLGRKSVLLTDYARFITDRYELRQTAALGVTGVEGMGKIERGDYLFRVAGPVFSNTDLAWYGPSEVQLSSSTAPVDPVNSPAGATWRQLGLLRDDRIEVVGGLRSGAALTGDATTDGKLLDAQPLQLRVWGAQARALVANVFKPDLNSNTEKLGYVGGFPDLRDLQPVSNTWRVLADLPIYNAPPPGTSLYPASFAVPRVQPPRMDAIEPDLHTNRYLTLTRDSGMWLRTGTSFVNNGAWGWGWVNKGGIYVDNNRDLQYVDRFGNHDLEALRLNWTGGYSRAYTPDPANPTVQVGVDGRLAGTTNWWDKSGRFYLPPGVEIILHGEVQALQGAQACPYIEIIRHDRRPYTEPVSGTTKWYYWQKPNGEYIPADQASATQYIAQGGLCNPLMGEPAVNVRQNRAIFPFPPNGVIYAEGNVRIRGVMPPARHGAKDSPYFGDDYQTGANWGRTRRYDLQVVSGGTIYIEGDLLTATSAGLQPSGMTGTLDKLNWDMINGSRLALLARDYVCLNTTALQPQPLNLSTVGPQGELIGTSYSDDQPLYHDAKDLLPPSYSLFSVLGTNPVNDAVPPGFRNGIDYIETAPKFVDYVYHNVRFQLPTLAGLLLDNGAGFILGHSAWYRKNGMDDENTELAKDPPTDPPGKQAKVDVELRVDSPPNDYWPWAGNKQYYTFRTAGAGGTEVAQAFSGHWYDETGTRAPFSTTAPLSNNYLEYLVFAGKRISPTGATYQLTGEDLIRLTPRVYPIWNDLPLTPAWVVKPKELGYIFGPLAITPPRGKPPLPVQIEALVYAQNGSWFVLPGPWFNEDPRDTLAPSDLGSPSQLQTALAAYPGPIYHEPLNIQILFSGAISENMPASPGDVAEWTSKWAGLLNSGYPSLSYSYDPLLRQYRTEVSRQFPRFPNLPLSPDLLIWGERVTGVNAAGL